MCHRASPKFSEPKLVPMAALRTRGAGVGPGEGLYHRGITGLFVIVCFRLSLGDACGLGKCNKLLNMQNTRARTHARKHAHTHIHTRTHLDASDMSF